MQACHLTSVHDRSDTRIFHKECQGLYANNINVTLIVADGRGKEISNGIRIIDVGKPKGRFSRILFSPWKVFAFARKLDIDVYHLHDPELLLIGLLLKMKGARVIYDIHEDYLTSLDQKPYFPRWFAWIFARFFATMEKIASSGFEKIIAEKYYEDRFPTAVKVLNYPIVKSKGIEQRSSTNNQLAATPEVLYTGSITEQRGALILAKLVERDTNIRLRLVGKCSATLYSKIKNQAGKNEHHISILGVGYHVPFEEIQKNYCMKKWLAGLAIFPKSQHYYRKELTKIFEYMEHGIPVICSNFPVWKKIVEGNQCGICVNPEDIDEQIEAIYSIFDHREIYTAYSKNGQAAIKDKYSWNSEELKLLDLYNRRITE